MKTFRVIIVLLLCSAHLALASEPLKVEKLIYLPTDLSASVHSVPDNNGNPCGLLKVITSVKDMSFEGSIVGTPEYKNGEYWVYLPSGTYQVRIKAENHDPYMLNFRDYNLSRVEAKATYELSFYFHDYEKLYMKNYKRIEGPSLKKYALSILALPASLSVKGITSLDYLQRISKSFSKYGDYWGIKKECTIIAEYDEDGVYSYMLIVESTNDESDAILAAGAGQGGFDERIYEVVY